MYDTLLFLHVLAAFALGAGVAIYSAFVFGSPVNRPTRLVAEILWGIGALGSLVLGIWLALYVDAYEIWDGWIIGAVVLWLAATGTGQQTSMAFQPAAGDESPIAVDQRVVLMHWLRTLLVIALLVVMVWKPGA